MATTILDALAHTVDTNVDSFAVSAGSNRIAFICLIGYYYTTGAAAPTSCTLGGQSMELVSTQNHGTRYAYALFKLEEAGIAAMSGNAVAFSGETFSARSSIYWSVQGAHQTTNPTVSVIDQSSGDVSASLVRTANSLTVAVVGNDASGSTFTNTNPAESAEYNVLSSIGISYGAATDTARTANFTATVPDSGLGSVGFAINIPEAGSSAPVLTSGTPTGTVGANPTVGCTTNTVANNIRFVIDTAANLDIVAEAQLILGQNETGSAAAYDSGAVAVTDTTPEFAFTGLANGTWAVRAIQYGGGNSNVLAWNITVAAEVALAGSATAESAATGALSIPRLVIADLYRPNAPDTLVADATGATVVLYDVCGGTEQAQGVADIVSGDIDCSFAGMGNVGDSRFVVLRWTVGADEYTYAATHTLAGA